MARAEINAGICGFKTVVETEYDGMECKVKITSECEAVRKLAAGIETVDPFQEMSFRGNPKTYEKGLQCLHHAACPVPAGIIKAIEVAAGLALPADVSIKIEK